MINLILGFQGHGKTLLAVKIAYEKHIEGKTIYSNVALNFPYKQIDYNDIINCKYDNAVVILDEIHLLLPARASLSKTSRLICDNFLSMVRKKNLDIYGTTQTIRKVDVRFREEADFMFYVEKYAYLDGNWSKVLHNQDLNKKIPILISIEALNVITNTSLKTSFIGNEYFNKYDSKQIIKIRGLNV
jgi:hypothetical protein